MARIAACRLPAPRQIRLQLSSPLGVAAVGARRRGVEHV